jgi:hypothetical protein
MPTGKRCGSPAQRDKAFCYHHLGNHRVFTRERLVCERLDRLGEKLDAMNAAELLNFVHRKLCTLPKTLTRFPEVSYTVTYALDRLSEIAALESTLRSFVQQNQDFAGMFRRTPPNPVTCQQAPQNQQFKREAHL